MARNRAEDSKRTPADRAPSGRARTRWSRLLADLAADHGPLEQRWVFTERTGLWTLRLVQRRSARTMVYLTVEGAGFVAGLALGERACRAAAGAGLSAAMLEAIERAPRYAEGRGVRVPVRTLADVADVRGAVALKMA